MGKKNKGQIKRLDLIIAPLIAWFATFFLANIYDGLFALLPFDALYLGWLYLVIGIICFVLMLTVASKRPSLWFTLYFIGIFLLILAFNILVPVWSNAVWTFA